MKVLTTIFFIICLGYVLVFFPFMLFGKTFHGYTWDTGQTVLLICMWLMSAACAWMYYPGKRGFIGK